jgi:hypothetical protein
MAPIGLTDAQIEQLRLTAVPIPRSLRSEYLQRVGDAMRARHDGGAIGDGDFHRICLAAQRAILQPRRPPDIAAGDVAAAVFIGGAMKGA